MHWQLQLFSTLALLFTGATAVYTSVNVTQYRDAKCASGGVVFTHTLGACDKGHLYSAPTQGGNITEQFFSATHCKGQANETLTFAQNSCDPMPGSVKFFTHVAF